MRLSPPQSDFKRLANISSYICHNIFTKYKIRISNTPKNPIPKPVPELLSSEIILNEIADIFYVYWRKIQSLKVNNFPNYKKISQADRHKTSKDFSGMGLIWG